MATQRGVAVDNRVHDSDFDDCDALLEDRMGDGWQLFFQTPDVQIRRRVTEGSSLTEFRLDGVMPFPTQLFVEMLTCLEYRKTYDKYTTEIRRMPGVLPDSESEAVYWRLKLPLLAERDYLFVRRILYEPSTQTYRLVSLSTQYGTSLKVKPPAYGCVRIEQYVSKSVMRPRGPDACEYHLLACQDLKGSVPSMVLDFFASKGLSAMVGGQMKACANFAAWRAAYRGEIGKVKIGRYHGAEAEEVDEPTPPPPSQPLAEPAALAGAPQPQPPAAPPPAAQPPPPQAAAAASAADVAASDSRRSSVAAATHATALTAGADDGPGGAGGLRMLSKMRSTLDSRLAQVQGSLRPEALQQRLGSAIQKGGAVLQKGVTRVEGAVSKIDGQLSAALTRAGVDGAADESARPDAAVAVTADYLELLKPAEGAKPMRLLLEAPRAPHHAPPPREAGGAAEPARAGGAPAHGGAAAPAPVYAHGLDQMRLDCAYRTPRGTLIRRTGLTTALLAQSIEIPILPRALIPPDAQRAHADADASAAQGGGGGGGGSGRSHPHGALHSGSLAALDSLSASLAYADSLYDAAEAAEAAAASTAEARPQADAGEAATAGGLRARARRAVEGALHGHGARPAGAPQPAAAAALEPADASVRTLEVLMGRAESHFQQRINNERRDDVAFEQACFRLAQSEARVGELEETLLALRLGEHARARRLLDLVDEVGPAKAQEWLATQGHLRARVQQGFGGAQPHQVQAQKLTVSERLALKMSI